MTSCLKLNVISRIPQSNPRLVSFKEDASEWCNQYLFKECSFNRDYHFIFLTFVSLIRVQLRPFTNFVIFDFFIAETVRLRLIECLKINTPEKYRVIGRVLGVCIKIKSHRWSSLVRIFGTTENRQQVVLTYFKLNPHWLLEERDFK